MPKIPTELNTIYEQMTDKLTAELFNAWLRGLCDGLEYAAKATESMMNRFEFTSAEHGLLCTVALALRQAEMAVLVDGLAEGSLTEDGKDES